MSIKLRLFKRSSAAVHGVLPSIVERLNAVEGLTLAPGSVVLDIGASVGAFAIAVALQLPHVRVFAVEPAPQNYRYLVWNIRANNVTHRVWPLNVAIGGTADPAGTALKYFPVWPTASWHCPTSRASDCEHASYSARTVTLPNLMEALNLSRVQWLKLDCEGCEWNAAADVSSAAPIDLVTIELHPTEALRGDGHAKLLVETLCPDLRIRGKLLWGLEHQAARMPAGFLTEGLLCSARLLPPRGAPALSWGPANVSRHRQGAPEPERRIFLLSSFSHDDLDQWPLIPHFFRHYQKSLGIEPELFLLILHSDSRNASGLARMTQWLNREYGVIHTTPVTEPYSSWLHMHVKHEILHRHVSARDWVVQVDADEFVFFPGGQSAREALDQLDMAGEDVHYGLMVDRLAANGNIDARPSNRSSLFMQYPLNCALTLLVQSSDMRKACAYRGYLRTTTGNHNVIGLNESMARNSPLRPKEAARVMAEIRLHFGERVYQLLPGSERLFLAAVRATPEFATAYHFKWIRGLGAKLERRAQTEVYTKGQYSDLRSILDRGLRLGPAVLRKLCNVVDLPMFFHEPVRALTARELLNLFLNIKSAHLTELLHSMGIPQSEEAPFLARLLQRNIHFSIARETNLPVH